VFIVLAACFISFLSRDCRGSLVRYSPPRSECNDLTYASGILPCATQHLETLVGIEYLTLQASSLSSIGIGAYGHPLMFFFLVGALTPIPLGGSHDRSGRTSTCPSFFAVVTALPPASAIHYTAWGITAFIFQYWMRRSHFLWWMRYNHVVSLPPV